MGEFLRDLTHWVLQALVWVIILNAILSWLVAFDVVNLRHPIVRQIAYTLDAINRPILRPFRRVIPPLGGIDITPVIAAVIITLIDVDIVPRLFAPLIDLIG